MMSVEQKRPPPEHPRSRCQNKGRCHVSAGSFRSVLPWPVVETHGGHAAVTLPKVLQHFKKKRKKRFFKNGVEMKILKQRCSNFVLYVLLALKHFMSLTLSLSMFSSLSGKLILLSGVGPLWMKTAAAVP